MDMQYKPENGHHVTDTAEAEELLVSVLENIVDAYIAVDAQWQFVYVNSSAERLLGLDRDDLLGRNQWDVFPLTMGTRLEEEYRLAAAGEARDFEIYWPTRNCWLHKRCLPRKGGGISVYFQDITLQKKAEEALLWSKDFVAASLDVLPIEISVLDAEGRILGVNRRWRDFADANPPIPDNYGIGINYIALCAAAEGDDREGALLFSQGIMAILAGEKSCYEHEYPCHSPTEQRWYLGRVYRMDEYGPVRLVVTHENVTEYKQAEEKLRLEQSRRQLQVVLDNLPMMAWLKDRNGTFLLVNQEFCRVVNLTCEKIIGRNDYDIWPRDIARYHHDMDLEMLATGERKTFEELLADSNGTTIVEVFTTPVTDMDGRVVEVTGIGRDITAIKKNERLIRDHQQELESLNVCLTERIKEEIAQSRAKDLLVIRQDKLASLGQLAAGVVHEINNPLAFISGNLETLEKYFNQMVLYDQFLQEHAMADLPPLTRERLEMYRHTLAVEFLLNDGVELLDETKDGVNRMVKIIQDLKVFSRNDSQVHEPVDLNSCLERSLTIVANELKYVSTIRKEYGSLPDILCDPGQMSQVFLNLLVNAGHAMESFGEILLRSWHDEYFVYASVSDTGCGISEEVQKHIFEPFYTTKKEKGTGLGLSISYDIIKRHFGDILVESEPGKGTTFTVKLPRSPAVNLGDEASPEWADPSAEPMKQQGYLNTNQESGRIHGTE
jgi:two-component system, NtrC family, sensor kinase